MNKLTKRILTANDVIAQIRSKAYVPTIAQFISPSTRRTIEDKLPWNGGNNAEFQTAVANATNCEACANGCLFLAHVARFDSVNSEQFRKLTHDTVQHGTPVAKVFTKKLLDEIEAIFEGRSYEWHRRSLSTQQIKRLNDFREKATGVKNTWYGKKDTGNGSVLDQGQRDALLIAIMERLIDNNGKRVVLG